MITRIRVGLSLLMLVPAFAFALQTDTEKLHQLATQFLREYSQEEHISAVAVTVKSPRHSIPISVYAGTTRMDQQHPIDENSLFQIGSISKSFITTILLKLESDPRYHFNINDPLTKFFPHYPKWQAITIKQLMNMSSGIPDYITPDIVESFTSHPYHQHDKNSWIDYIYQKPLLFKPGTRYGYSNTNYFLLGMVIEKLTSHTLAYEIKKRIIIPFQLKHTHYIPHKPKANLVPYLVHGYQNENGFMDYIPRGTDVTEYSLSYMDAAGGVISNSKDVAKWVDALFTPGKVLTYSQFKKMIAIISQKTGQHTQQLSAEDPLGFGLGIRVQYSPIFNSSYYIYQGMTLGYRAIYFYIPTRDTLIAITVNSSFDGKENHLIGLINQIGEKM